MKQINFEYENLVQELKTCQMMIEKPHLKVYFIGVVLRDDGTYTIEHTASNEVSYVQCDNLIKALKVKVYDLECKLHEAANKFNEV